MSLTNDAEICNFHRVDVSLYDKEFWSLVASEESLKTLPNDMEICNFHQVDRYTIRDFDSFAVPEDSLKTL